MKKTVYYAEMFEPGIICSESYNMKLGSWGTVDEAKNKAISEVGGAFGFNIKHRTEDFDGDEMLTGSWVNDTKTIYVKGTVKTLSQVKDQHPNERILISNMECNKWDRVIMMPNGQAFPFEDGNELLKPETEPDHIADAGEMVDEDQKALDAERNALEDHEHGIGRNPLG